MRRFEEVACTKTRDAPASKGVHDSSRSATSFCKADSLYRRRLDPADFATLPLLASCVDCLPPAFALGKKL